MSEPTKQQSPTPTPRPEESELGDDALDSVAGGCQWGDSTTGDTAGFPPVQTTIYDPRGGGCGLPIDSKEFPCR